MGSKTETTDDEYKITLEMCPRFAAGLELQGLDLEAHK